MARRLRVLVVEDDDRVRALIRDVLEGTAVVTGAANVEQARRALGSPTRRRFDLAIIDCLLPGPEGPRHPYGVELIVAVHAECPELPILIITGAAHAEALLADASRTGPHDLLRKPFDIDDLRTGVARLTEPRRQRTESRRRPADAGVARVVTFLAEHVGQPVSLDELARVAAMSPTHLSRTFHVAVGLPLRDYVRNLRLERAHRMLLSTPRASLTEIALDAGFYDLPHFDKAFRGRFGISPSEFRRRKGLSRLAGPSKERRGSAGTT